MHFELGCGVRARGSRIVVPAQLILCLQGRSLLLATWTFVYSRFVWCVFPFCVPICVLFCVPSAPLSQDVRWLRGAHRRVMLCPL